MQSMLTLNDHHQIPILGFGTYKSTKQDGVESVKFALQNGYRLIDTAAVYGNEEAVGKGIRLSGVPREEIVVTTKLWRTELGYKKAKEAFYTSLDKLQLDYVDMYLIHWPANAKNYSNWQQANADAWRAMEELQSEGRIKSIGVSNFWEEHLDALLTTANRVPAINQIEFHPGYYQPELTQYCKGKGIVVESWSPLARGHVFGNETLQSVARDHNKSISQICLRWIIQQGVVAIPKSSTPERIQENIGIFDFNLTEAEMTAINNLPLLGFSGELPNHWPGRVSPDKI